jgi:ribosomal protein S12 methylthiotransferase accessory factor
MSRALTEVAQLAGDFNSGSNYVASGLPKFTNIADAAFITHPDTLVDLSDLPDLSNSNIRVEVENLIAALKQKDFQVLAIDTRHPDLDIPAFYTIIPGAHFRERAVSASVGMFTARLIIETLDPIQALDRLECPGNRPCRINITPAFTKAWCTTPSVNIQPRYRNLKPPWTENRSG